jgi:integrase
MRGIGLVRVRPHLRLAVTGPVRNETETLRTLPVDVCPFLDPADFVALLDHLPADVADLVEWTYYSAWRRAMVEGLQWNHVELQYSAKRRNLTGASVRLPGVMVKNKTPLTIPVTGVLLDILRRRVATRDLRCPFVFHQDGKQLSNFRTAWTTACTAIGRESLLLHDLRRSAARNLRRAGVDESTIMRIGGWKTASMFKRYAITDDTDVRDGFAKLDAYVARAKRQASTVRPLRPTVAKV